MLTREFQKRFIIVLRKIIVHYSESTTEKTLDLLGHEDGIMALEKLMEKELPEKEFLKELSILEETNSQET